MSGSKSVHPLLADAPGRRELLLGNEAIVRGAIEAGIGLVSGYPGTPASEIGDTFHELHAALGIPFEYSVNEKVALEVAFGASLAGVRSLTSMKHLGLTYAGDPLSTMPYIGAVGGMVIVSAADPGCLTSPNEQDQRHLGRMLGLPTLDPATPEEARRMTAWAFELSEACELPVLMRITTRVCHSRAAVEFGPLPAARPRGRFRKNPARFLPTPANARHLREELQRRLDRACELITASPFNFVHPAPDHRGTATAPRRGLISAGAPRNVVRHLALQPGLDLPHLELGVLHPLPHELIVPFLRTVDEVLVIEELTPYLEDSLLAMAQHYGVATRIHGKRDGRMPWPFELEPEEVELRIREFVTGAAATAREARPAPLPVPPRPPVLCPGCLHRNVFHAVTAVFGRNAVYVNDIGCYTLGAAPPYEAGDVLLAMGSSIPMAAGIARTTGERVVAFIGDSTFFHSGMPALLNSIEQADNIVVVVLDNHVTAMTGMQRNVASVPAAGTARARRRIGDVVRALGVEDVTAVDASRLPELMQAFTRARSAQGLSVLVAEGPCALNAQRQPERPRLSPAHIDPGRCHTCGMKEAGLHCGLEPTQASQRRLAAQRAQLTPLAASEVPRTSPCSVECPLGICIPAYVGAIAAGEPERALAAVTLRAALPSVCSHICHRPCEDVCVRSGWERPVGVNALKRYLTEFEMPTPAPRAAPDGLPVAIVGAGPAGLAAARELLARGYAPTLFEARERAGGMLEYAIPDYRLPREVLRRDVANVLAQGAVFAGNQRLGRDFTLDELRRRGFRAILLALGAQRAARPAVPGADAPGVIDALSLLDRPPDLSGCRVLVAGGGDVAIEAARVALRRGAREVMLAFPEPEAAMAAAGDAVLLAREEGVVLLPDHAVTAITPDDEGGLQVALGKVEGFTRRGRAVAWERLEPAEPWLVDRVIWATGQRLDPGGLMLPPECFSDGQWLGGDDCGRTPVADVFVAGDATGPTTVTIAMAAGVRAAYAIDEALAAGRPVAPPAAPLPRPAQHHRAVRGLHFRESDPPLSAAEAQAEAARCLLCGMCANCNTCVEVLACPAITRDADDDRPRVVAELCTSCRACIQACPNEAIVGCA